jgi:hypothetical protein
MKKKKNLYYICSLEGSLNNDVSLDEVTIEDLRKYNFKYVSGYFDEDDIVPLTDDINDKSVLKGKKLYDFVQSFLIGNTVDIDDETLSFRIDLLYEEYFVFRMDTETKLLKYVEDDVIYNCIESATASNRTSGNRFKFEDFTSPENNTLNVDYMSIFTEYLDKCFGKNKRGVATFITDEHGQAWDIVKTEKSYSFGVDESQNKLLQGRVIDLFKNITSATLRVFTDDIVDKFPVKEVYGFVLTPDFTIKNVSYLEIKESHTTDNRTGNKIYPEKNVVYCDIDGNRLCSADI